MVGVYAYNKVGTKKVNAAVYREVVETRIIPDIKEKMPFKKRKACSFKVITAGSLLLEPSLVDIMVCSIMFY